MAGHLGFDLDEVLLAWVERLDRWGGFQLAPMVYVAPVPEMYRVIEGLDDEYRYGDDPPPVTPSGAFDALWWGGDATGFEYVISPASELTANSRIYMIGEGSASLSMVSADGDTMTSLTGDDRPSFGDWLEALVVAYREGRFERFGAGYRDIDVADLEDYQSSFRHYPWPPVPAE